MPMGGPRAPSEDPLGPHGAPRAPLGAPLGLPGSPLATLGAPRHLLTTPRGSRSSLRCPPWHPILRKTNKNLTFFNDFTMPQWLQKGPPEAPRDLLWDPKGPPKDPLMTPGPPQGLPRTPPRTPRNPQGAPRTPQDLTKDPCGLPWRTAGGDFALYENRCIFNRKTYILTLCGLMGKRFEAPVISK